MTFDAFTASLEAAAPPTGCPPLLTALWHDRRGDWNSAHRLAQDVEDVNGAWVHAYLHRREGDQSNAAYWYRLAGRPISAAPLDDEWTTIVQALL
jgi:hypothetical protein